MTRTRISLISMTALASMLGAALPAFAQAPAPAPMYAPAPAMAPGMAPPPGQEVAVIPVAPVMAPRAADDMTGSVGFGVGVSTGTSLVAADTANLMVKYWMSDAMSLMPRLALNITKVKGGSTQWQFSPSVLANFNLLKGASTRFDAGLGLGLALAKNYTPIDIGHGRTTFAGADTTATYIALYVPVQLGVEHFFTRWFSMGIAANFDFLRFEKQGSPWQLKLEVSDVTYLGSLFFYTD